MTKDPPDTPQTERRLALDDFTDRDIDDLIDDIPGGHSAKPATRRLLQHLLELRRVPRPRPAPTAPTLPGMDDDIVYAPAQLVRTEPGNPPEVGWIVRKRDVTGISGVGYIGCYFVSPDGAAVERWFGGPPQNEPSWRFFDNPGTEPFRKISGHNGNTVLVRIPLELPPDE